MSHSWPMTSERRCSTRKRHSLQSWYDPRLCSPKPGPSVSAGLSHNPTTTDPTDCPPEPMTTEPSPPPRVQHVSSGKRKSDSDLELDCPRVSKKSKSNSPIRKRKFKTRGCRSKTDDTSLRDRFKNTPEDDLVNTVKQGPIITEPNEGSDDQSFESRTDNLSSSDETGATAEERATAQKRENSFYQLFFESDRIMYEARPSVVQEFTDKYQIQDKRGEGGYARVFNGKRKNDNHPVAIKVINKLYVPFIVKMENGIPKKVPLEAHIICEAGAGPDSTGSKITPCLLDWYDTGHDVLLVLERPEPCYDLAQYLISYHPKGLDENLAKIIFRQLVEGAIEMEAREIFHRDIKIENILIRAHPSSPTVWYIDFGRGIMYTPGQTFMAPQGTHIYSSPEWFRREPYSAGPTTVWQLGTVLYMMMTMSRPLKQEKTIGSFRKVPVPEKFSIELINLLSGCLDKDPETRFTLDDLINHPWLNTPDI